MIAIHDRSHWEIVAEFDNLDEAIAEFSYLASTPWDESPNRCPCKQWRTCGRDYELCEINDAQLPWK